MDPFVLIDYNSSITKNDRRHRMFEWIRNPTSVIRCTFRSMRDIIRSKMNQTYPIFLDTLEGYLTTRASTLSLSMYESQLEFIADDINIPTLVDWEIDIMGKILDNNNVLWFDADQFIVVRTFNLYTIHGKLTKTYEGTNILDLYTTYAKITSIPIGEDNIYEVDCSSDPPSDLKLIYQGPEIKDCTAQVIIDADNKHLSLPVESISINDYCIFCSGWYKLSSDTLKVMHLSSCDIINTLQLPDTLKELSLYKCYPQTLSNIIIPKSLKILSIVTNNKLTPSNITMISRLTNLRHITLEGLSNTKLPTYLFRSMPNLKTLEIIRTSIKLFAPMMFQKNIKLEFVVLNDNTDLDYKSAHFFSPGVQITVNGV